jgi:hypothetical protein
MSQVPTSSKRIGLLLVSAIAALCCVFVYQFSRSKPPEEKKLIDNFYAHRAEFDRLRDMLLEDKDVLRVASWGVETTKSMGGRSIPPEGGFPVNRYNEYLALLRETGGIGAFRGRGDHPESVSISVWATGWGSSTRHIHIYWSDHAPPNEVHSLDDYYLTEKPRHPVFRHIDGNWYLWADW